MDQNIPVDLDTMKDAIEGSALDIRAMQQRIYDCNVAHGFHSFGAEIRERLDEAREGLGRDDSAVAEVEFWERAYVNYHGNNLMLMSRELGEAHEVLRDGHAPEEVYFSIDDHGRRKPEGLPMEIVDEIIRGLDTLHELGHDAATLMHLKVAYNEAREFKHGRTM